MINNVKTIRISKGLTQEEMSRKIDISLRHYQNIENNKNNPNIEIVLKIKNALQCEIEELFRLN